ncbi:ornithine cyclodeaminase family protein [Sneathiella chinensis]|uniref:Ornithine cyclodeaminase n=1 Tax=Sneathiella chinensis TaxID=349750 RepID=A0ABQ5TZS7_9PROT|nr:ornithine cyclodeaminase family protein [Sneathiella chinensis]GLQ05114.1 ornithine cyclodeaminase [Sneathiella chinensis]
MRILSTENVASLLPMTEAIDVVEKTMIAVARGTETLPLRTAIPVGGGNMMGVMPGAISDPACFGVKLVSLFPGNPDKGLSSHRGAIVLFEAETGGAIAMMDAGLLTAVRTAAASGAATRALARKDATTLTLVGYGEQAEHHLDAICAVRPISRVQVVGRSTEKAAAFADRAKTRYPDLEITAGTDIQSAVQSAHIVCTVTASPTPLLNGDWVRPGTHLNVVGSSIPSMREVDDATVLKSSIWVDYRPSWEAQAGEIVDMVAAGTLTTDYLQGEIGAVYSGDLPGRTDADQITFYRSLGVAAQDLAAAHHVLNKAIQNNIGQDVSF